MYLEGEPNRLIDGIAVTAETYEQRKSFRPDVVIKTESSKLT